MAAKREDDDRDGLGTGEADGAMAHLLARWGRGPFECPARLPRLESDLDEIDDAADRSAAVAARTRRRARFLAATVAAAALLGVVAGVSDRFDRLSSGSGSGSSPATVAPRLDRVRLSTSGSLVRGASEIEFRSGDDLVLLFRSDRPAVVIVAVLDSRDRFVTLTPEPVTAPAGTSRIGSFVMDDVTGVESFVLVGADPSFGAAALGDLVERVRAAAPGEARSHAERLAAILGALRAREGVAAEAVTISHR